MLERNADLHVHTYLSDGTFSPEEVIQFAKEKNLSAIAITDHDCIDGIKPSINIAKDYDIEIIPGVELTAEAENLEVHILGFFIDWEEKWFQRKLKAICKVRVKRVYKMVGKLKKLGICVDAEEVFKTSGPGAVGRLHLAQVLQKGGFVSSIDEAFKKYIGNGGPCYVRKFRLTPKEAIGMILKIGGVPVLAHPHLMGREELISCFVAYGLRGIEVYHSDHTNSAIRQYENIARKYNLLITGGSDCHGMGKGKILMGEVKVPYELVEKLKQAADEIKS